MKIIYASRFFAKKYNMEWQLTDNMSFTFTFGYTGLFKIELIEIVLRGKHVCN